MNNVHNNMMSKWNPFRRAKKVIDIPNQVLYKWIKENLIHKMDKPFKEDDVINFMMWKIKKHNALHYVHDAMLLQDTIKPIPERLQKQFSDREGLIRENINALHATMSISVSLNGKPEETYIGMIAKGGFRLSSG